MTSPDLLDITFRVTRVLEKLGIPYYIGGSLASSAFGMARATLEWHKAGGQIGERQWLDVLGVIKVQASLLDVDYLEKWAARINVLDLLVKALREGGMG